MSILDTHLADFRMIQRTARSINREEPHEEYGERHLTQDGLLNHHMKERETTLDLVELFR